MYRKILATLLFFAALLSIAGCDAGPATEQMTSTTTAVAEAEQEKKLMRIEKTDFSGDVTSIIFSYDEDLLTAVEYSDDELSGYTYLYDEEKRLIEIWSSFWEEYGEPNIKYHYDENGYLVRTSGIGEGGGENKVYENDALGRPVRCTEIFDWGSSITNYTYSEDGCSVTRETTVTNEYDEDDVTVWRTTYAYTYDAEGRKLSESIEEEDNTQQWYYSYDYKLFVAWSEEEFLPHRYAMQDVTGREIWSLETGVPESVITDADGYIQRIVCSGNQQDDADNGDNRDCATYVFFYDDGAEPVQLPSESADSTENTETEAEPITAERAYEIACAYWDYTEGDVSPETGFEFFVVPEFGGEPVEDTETGRLYFSFLLRWLVEEAGDRRMSTCDIVYVDALTGECVNPY